MKTAIFWTVTQCSLVDGYHGYAAHSSDVLVPSYQTTSCHNAEDHNMNGAVTYSK